MFRLIFLLFLINFIVKIHGKDFIEKEQDVLDKNLKVLRQDFNKLVENVEDLATDFLKQIEDAGKLIQNTYVEDDYNWQQDKVTTEETPKSTTERLILSNRKIPHMKTLNNEINKRTKRSTIANNKNNNNNGQANLPLQEVPNQPLEFCGKTRNEIEAEEQKLKELKAEVQKLNELTVLLKNQQNLMKNIATTDNNEINESSFLFNTIKMMEKELKDNKSINQELNQLKLNIKKTESSLNKTQEMLFLEKDREDFVEKLLKKHNTDLKFLKVMMENLYDKTYTNVEKSKDLEAKDSSDKEATLGAIHIKEDNPLELFEERFQEALRANERNTEMFLRRLAEEQEDIRRRLLSQNEQINEDSFFTNQRRRVPERFNMLRDRASEPIEENQDTNMHRLINILNQKSQSDNNQLKSGHNATTSSRASSKSDDLDFKLKIIDLLSKEGKSDDDDDDDGKEKLLALLKPEKKSDDLSVSSLIKLLQKRPKSEDNLTKLLKTLKPQSKTDDFELEDELRQLQRAINNLRPKQDSFDLLSDNRRGKDESQDFQAMLTQLVAQNNVNPPLNLAAGAAPQRLAPYFQTSGSSSSSSQTPSGYGAFGPAAFESSSSSSSSIAPNLYDAFRNYGPNFNSHNIDFAGNGYYSSLGSGYGNGGNFYNGKSQNYGVGSVLNGFRGYGPIYAGPSDYISSSGYPAASNGFLGGCKNCHGAAPVGYGGDYGTNFFQSIGAAGGSYPDNNYGPKSYAGPSMDQSYGNGQIAEQYKYGMINDLTQQIQNLEAVINGLNQGNGYYGNNYDDKATIARLDQKIYELKGVLNGLNRPQQGVYEQNQASQSQYRQNQVQPPQPLKQPPQPNYVPPQNQPHNAPPPSPPPQPIYQPKALQPSTGHTNAASTSSSTGHQAYQQPKFSMDEDRNMNMLRNIFGEGKRRKRQIEPVMDNNGWQYAFGEDPLVKIVDTFKKYLEETLGSTDLQAAGLNNMPQGRSSALDGLQQKLDSLKLQLGSKPFVPDVYSNDYNNAPYGAVNNYFPNLFTNNNKEKGSSLLEKFEDKKVDFLSKIIGSLLDKGVKLLPFILNNIFGHLVGSIGDSYGDYYSPLQNLLQNLGPLGYFPLILVKILESFGNILKYLKKNHFFKSFLLPALVLGLVGGAILFLIYFLEQDEPYGYISYEGANHNGHYPHYDHHNDYNNNYRTATNPEQIRPYYRPMDNNEQINSFRNYANKNAYYSQYDGTRKQLDPVRPYYKPMDNGQFASINDITKNRDGFIGHNPHNVYSRGYNLDNGFNNNK